MSEHNQLAGGLRAVLKKKLEKIVDDNLDRVGRGQLTDLNLVQYQGIAREHGFTKLADDLGALISLFGEAFIEHLRYEEIDKKAERSYPERRLEDYLTTPGRLDLIEKGLKLVNRQYETRSGILDIFAKDGNDQDVIIELKMNHYDNQKVITQIEKYINDRPDARLIFVAPYISSTVFWRFKPLVDKGQISFYRVAESGRDYAISPEDGSNIPMPKNIKFRKKKPKQDVQVSYDIFRPKRRRGIKKVEDKCKGKKSSALLKEEVEAQRRMKLYPFFYQVICMTQAGAKDKKDYLTKRIPISREQKRELEELLLPARMKEAFSLCDQAPIERTALSNMDLLTREDLKRKFNKAMYHDATCVKAVKRIEAENPKMKTLMNKICGILNASLDQTLGEDFAELEQEWKEHRDMLIKTKYSKEVIKYGGSLKKIVENTKGDNLPYFQIALRSSLFIDETMFCEYVAAKIERAKKLMQIDELLGKAYLKFSPLVDTSFENLKKEGILSKDQSSVTVPDEPLYNLSLRDNELYAQILDRFVVQDSSELESKVGEKPSEPQRVPTHPKSHKIKDACTELYNAIATHENVEDYTADNKARLLCFAEDAIAHLPKDKAALLGETFKQWKLARKFRKRQALPTDMKIRNFFDDVTLEYLRNGEVPSKDTLEKLYEKA